MDVQIIDSFNDTRWLQQSLKALRANPKLSTKDIERIIVDSIGDYITGEIGVLDLLEFVDVLKACKPKLIPDLKYIIEDLSELHKYKSDKQFIHNILIDVLRKITKT